MNKELLKVYKGKKVLVTGHTGFKGSWLCVWLNELGAQVIGYSLDPKSSKDNFVLSKIQEKIIDIRADIRDSTKLNEVFEKHNPEVVFHLAAQPIVSTSYTDPKYTYEVNVIGTINVLEAMKKYHTKTGIMITSDKCYENKEWNFGYREIDELGGHDPYSSSKACAEIVISSFRRSFLSQINLASVRAGNVIGGGDWSDNRIIPDCINALENNKPIILRNPDATRPWQHVLEPLSGYLTVGALMLKGNKLSEAWNFGPKQENIVKVHELVKLVISEWGSGEIKIEKGTFHEAGLLSLDISKAAAKLNWKPRWDAKKAIEKTIEWYKNYHTANMYDICKKQIEEYNE